jgi:peptide deformylase
MTEILTDTVKSMKLDLVYYGKDILSQVAEDVQDINDDLLETIDSMFGVMYREKGVGLAGPQVGLKKRIIVIDPGNDPRHKIALINPVILESSDTTEPYDEGCLSLPGLIAAVIRPSEILLRAVNSKGKNIEIEAGGIMARVIQHEIDHLNGILFIDRIEKFVRDEMKFELKKIKKMNVKTA